MQFNLIKDDFKDNNEIYKINIDFTQVKVEFYYRLRTILAPSTGSNIDGKNQNQIYEIRLTLRMQKVNFLLLQDKLAPSSDILLPVLGARMDQQCTEQ